MKIALDYDQTYTLDSEFWDDFITMALSKGHSVTVVTMRNEATEPLTHSSLFPVIYTNRRAKCKFFKADVWIDDSPHWIYQDAV